MIKVITLYKNYTNLNEQKVWLSYGHSNMATINTYDSFQQINFANTSQDACHLYLICDDSIFWENAENNNFLFITFLRINGEQNKQIETLIEDSKNYEDFICCYTYDAYELVVAHYDNSVDGISKCFNFIKKTDLTIFESNSLLLSRKSIIGNPIMAEEKIPLVSIRYRLKNQKKFELLDKNLTELNFIRTIRNGNYDYEYFYKDMPYSTFFSLYRDEKVAGVDYSYINEAVAELETRIYSKKILPADVIDVKDNKRGLKFIENTQIDNSEFQTNDFIQYCDFLNTCYKEEYYNDLFTSVYAPVRMMIVSYLNRINDLIEKGVNYYSLKISYDKMINAMNELLLIFNNSRLHTLRGFAYRGEKIAIPFKFLSFYTAVLSNMKDILIEDKTQYHYQFLLLPTTDPDIHVEIMFSVKESVSLDEYKQRLLIVTLPITYISKPRIMISQIGHEIAHYVCDETRQRTFRMNCIWSAMKELIYDELLEYKGMKGKHDNKIKEAILYELETIFNKQKDIVKNNIQLNSNGKQWFRNQLKTIIPKIIRESLMNIVLNYDKLKENIVYKLTVDAENYEVYAEYHKDIMIYLNDVKLRTLSIMNEKEIERKLKFYLKLCDECFSDIVTCMMLDLNASDYCEYFVDRYFSNLGNNIPDFTIARMALVMGVLHFDDLDQFDKTTFSEEKKTSVENSIDLSYYFVSIYELYKESEKKGTVCDLKGIRVPCYFPKYLKSHGVVIYLMKYLVECELKLAEQFKKNNSQSFKLKSLFNIFNNNLEDSDLAVYEYVQSIKGKVIYKCKKKNNQKGNR